MFWKWVLDGVAAGVRIAFAVFTVAGFAAGVLALFGLLSYAMQGGEHESKKARRY